MGKLFGLRTTLGGGNCMAAMNAHKIGDRSGARNEVQEVDQGWGRCVRALTGCRV